jgi:hypothetical protein
MGFVDEPIGGEERAAVGLAAALHHGAYGLVTGLARGLGPSRQFVYRLGARAIVPLALVGRASERAIVDCLDELYGVRPSLGDVDGVLGRASAAAAARAARLRPALPEAEVAAAELVVGGRAQLGAVAPASLLVLAAAPVEPGHPADAAAWRRVFAGLDHVAFAGTVVYMAAG